MKFQRSLSMMSLFFSAVGSIVGSGWLFGPLYASQIAGPGAVFSWIIGGLLMMVIAFTFAELASTFPVAGGMVRFAEYSYGPFLSFTLGWIVWLSAVAVAPVETLALIQYLSNFFPHLVFKVHGVHILSSSGFIIAALLMFLLTLFNSFGVKIFSRLSNSLVIFKLLIPLLTGLFLLIIYFHANDPHIWHPLLPAGWKGIIAALPLGGVIYSFIGYSTAIQLAEEAKNPRTAIPFAIIGALTFCIFLYVFLQIAFIHALRPEFVAHGWKNIAFPGDSGPFASLMGLAGLGIFVSVIYIDAFLSPLATAFIYTASTARVGYALAETGLFSSQLGSLSSQGIPFKALLINYLVGLTLFLPFPGWQSMISFITSAFIIAYSIGPLALVRLRVVAPEHSRPFKVPMHKTFCFLAFYICNLMIYWTSWQTISKLMIFIILGIVWFALRYQKNLDIAKRASVRDCLWLFPYLIGLSIISYCGNFGGKNWLSFGPDFVVIAIFSLAIYCWAFMGRIHYRTSKLDIE